MSRTTQGARDTSSHPSPDDPAEPSQDRYRRGSRRTGAQPLAASWRPEGTGGESGGRPARKGGVGGFLSTYGWRVYALPVLLVVTALVVLQTAGESDPDTTASGSGPVTVEGGSDDGGDDASAATGGQDEPGAPGITELNDPIELNIPTAELPAGPEYTSKGAGTWRLVPGQGPKVGSGAKSFTYTVEVEEGIDPSQYGDDQLFAKLVDTTLNDPRGWTTLGQVSLQRVDTADADFRVSLTTPETLRHGDHCGYSIKYEASCYRNSEQRVFINLSRWVRGAVAFDGDMLSYRQYAVNHEVGHAFRLNLQHVGCNTPGGLAPVMMQQSFGVNNNYVAELNRAVNLNDLVPADGVECKPNPWPNPQAQTGG